MNKKSILLVLAAISAAMCAVPVVASAADVPLHLNPSPSNAKAITGGASVLSNTSGLKVTCNEVSGSATFETGGTTGSMSLTFKGDCREDTFGTTCNSEGEPSGSIATTTLPFHLLTLPNKKPGVLVTPAAGSSHFATFKCAGGTVTVDVVGNGAIGTITSPACGSSATSSTISFKATANGQQEHKKVEGTEETYDLLVNGSTAAMETSPSIAMGTSTSLECT